ncbi:hypothetical protein XENOCAPTIV_025673 [Xenoophorus captivus]|uniref:Transcription initiation factor TFIID component TAF4 C-terminal domain-containing protein n=1 Tax=Xenoophorus captivus TaxID=1517983 RepID=A0ABV0RK62_9TELE
MFRLRARTVCGSLQGPKVVLTMFFCLLKPLTVNAAGAVKMPAPQKTSTAFTAGMTSAAKPAILTPTATTTAPPGARVTVVSQVGSCQFQTFPAVSAGFSHVFVPDRKCRKTDDDDINDVASMAGVNLNEENARILATSSELVGTKIRSCKDESFLPPGLLHRRILDSAKKLGVTEVPLDVVNLISHATESRLRSLLEKASMIAQHRADGAKPAFIVLFTRMLMALLDQFVSGISNRSTVFLLQDEGNLTYEQTSDVRSQLRFFEALERMEKQRKDEQEREMLLKAAKMQQQELAQMRQRDANLTALAAIGPRKKRKLDSGGGASGGSETLTQDPSSISHPRRILPLTEGGQRSGSSSSASSSRQQLRQRITRVNLRDFILCLEQDRSTARSLTLYKALLK